MSLSPGAAAVQLLKTELAKDRSQAWRSVASLVPGLKPLISRHLRLIKLVESAPKPRSRRIRDRRSKATHCACGQPLPHPPRVKGLPLAERMVLGRCLNYFVRRSWVNRSWRGRDALYRRERTAPARAARRAKDLARWTAKLDPRLVRTLGQEQAVRQYVRAFNSHIRPSRRLKDVLGEDFT